MPYVNVPNDLSKGALGNFIRAKFLRPGVRPYQTQNSRVEVYRDYNLHIDFNIDFGQFSGGLDIAAIAAYKARSRLPKETTSQSHSLVMVEISRIEPLTS